MMRDITEKQKIFLDFIEDFTDKHGKAPTIGELSNHFSIKPSTVSSYLSALQRKQQISRNSNSRKPNLIRSDRLVPVYFSIPLLGRINAGLPAESVAYQEGEIVISADLVKHKNLHKIFALNVQGDSMRDAGVFNGDLVVVEQSDLIKPGDIIVALINDEVTIKSYFPSGRGKIELRPANPEFKSKIYLRGQIVIQGKVIALQRKYH
jgi:repressor LexA